MATPILMPRQGQSVESCILIAWKVAPGDTVETGGIVAEIETDKATFEVESPAAGTVVELFFKEGADIPVLTHIAAVGDAGEDVSALRPDGENGTVAAPEPAAVEAAPAPVAAAPVAAAPGSSVGVSPRARGLASANGIDAAALAGSGPGGRVIERDVQAAVAAGPRLSGAARDAMGATGLAAPAIGSGPGGMVLSGDLQAATAAVPTGEEFYDKPLPNIRKIIARKMHESLANTAQLTFNRSFDVSALQAFRAKVKANGEAMGLPNITLNDMVVCATSKVLMRHPDLNAHFLGDGVRYYNTVHMGVAVDTDRGLMVPVVRNAQTLSLSEISTSAKPLIEAAQSGSISPDHLQGGTFTITNLGMMGIESFTPVLNTPEVGILGVCGIVPKAVMNKDGSVKHVPSITLSLTVNHQVVDGSPAARFLQDLVDTLENFELALAG